MRSWRAPASVKRDRGPAQFEHRGRKGWLTKSDLLQLYAGVRGHGISEVDARALLTSFRAEADVRHWVWVSASPTPSEMDDRLQLLVGKVAAQARRRRHVTKGFHHALLAEVVGANVDTRMLLDAVAERRRLEHWPASFDPCWYFDGDESTPWWERTFLHMRQFTARRLVADPSPVVRPVAPSWLRIAAPLLLLLTTISFNRPLVASSAAALASPESALTAPTNLVLPSVAPTAVIGASAAPAPVTVQQLRLVVSHTDGVGARLRTAPATGPVARLLGEGTAVVVIGSEMQVDGTAWMQVRAPDGTPGWMAADLLGPQETETAPSAAYRSHAHAG